MEQTLRIYGLGATQWYVLYHLTHFGSMKQQDLKRQIQLEHATLSRVISSLIHKELVDQLVDKDDRRHKLLSLTPAGIELWSKLPDLAFIQEVAFENINDEELKTVIRVLQKATSRLDGLLQE